jgi:hypothetical protein
VIALGLVLTTALVLVLVRVVIAPLLGGERP